MEEVGIFQIGEALNILEVHIGIQQAAACIGKRADNEAILDRGMKLMADDDVQLAGLKLGQKVGDRSALQAEVNGGVKGFEVRRYLVIKLCRVPCFRASKSYGSAELGNRGLNLGNKIVIVIKACLQKII